MRNWQWPYVVTKCITTSYITYNLAPRPTPMWLWHYSGYNPPTWFSNKIGLWDVESNDQTEQSNNQTEQWSIGETRATHWFCLKWRDTESETESITPELYKRILLLSDGVDVPGNPQTDVDIIPEPSRMCMALRGEQCNVCNEVNIALDIALQELDCCLALYVSSTTCTFTLYIKPWLYSESCYDDHLLPMVKVPVAGCVRTGTMLHYFGLHNEPHWTWSLHVWLNEGLRTRVV